MKRFLIALLIVFSSVSALTVNEPLVMNKSAYVTGFVGNVSFVEFDWGDYTIQKGHFPMNHTYNESGTFNLLVTAFDYNGSYTEVRKKIVIAGPSSTYESKTLFELNWFVKIVSALILIALALKFAFLQSEVKTCSALMDMRIISKPKMDYKMYIYVLKNLSSFDSHAKTFVFIRSIIYFVVLLIFVYVFGVILNSLFSILSLL